MTSGLEATVADTYATLRRNGKAIARAYAVQGGTWRTFRLTDGYMRPVAEGLTEEAAMNWFRVQCVAAALAAL